MNLLFPIETQSREFDYKLVLACLALKNNPSLNVFLGSVPAIHSNRNYFKNGLYFGKTIFTKLKREDNIRAYRKWKNQGFDIMYLHEEGGIWYGDESNWESLMFKMYDLDIFDQNDYVCLWGGFQKGLEQKRNVKNLELKVTGNPRFDILSEYPGLYESKVEQILEKYGDFVLINGKYSRVNHGESFRKVKEDLKRFKGDKIVAEINSYSLLRSQAKKLYAMIELVLNLALKFPAINFIMRPHPSESLSFYEDIFFGIKNILVVREGSANEFMSAAKAVIHDGCTTSIEAAKANIPILNYRVEKDHNDFLVPSEAGEKLESIGDCLSILEEILAGRYVRNQFTFSDRSIALIENLKDNFSSFNCLNELIGGYFADKGVSDSNFPSSSVVNKWYRNRKLKLQVSNFKNGVLGNNEKLKRNAYHLNKFPGFDKADLEYKLGVLNSKLDGRVYLDFYNKEMIRLYVNN